jgi:hypothetical protein
MLPGMERHHGVFIAVAIVSAVAATIALVALGAEKQDKLELFHDRIALGKRAFSRTGLVGEVVPWKQPHLWTTIGSAVRLRNGEASLCIGGRDHLLPPGNVHDPVQRVDASLSAEDFVAFVEALGIASTEARSVGSDERLVIQLVASPTSSRGVWRLAVPWFATMALAGLIGISSAAFPVMSSGAGQVVIMVLTVVIVLGGLVWTFVRALSPPPADHWLVLVGNQLTLESGRPERPPASAEGPPIRATRCYYRYATRGSAHEIPTLRLDWPSGKSTTIGVWDTGHVWSERVERSRKLHHLVGAEEWRRVIRAVGLPP